MKITFGNIIPFVLLTIILFIIFLFNKISFITVLYPFIFYISYNIIFLIIFYIIYKLFRNQ